MRRSRWADWVEPAHTEAELDLVPIFGIRAWSAASDCRDVHPHGPIPAGSRCCCMACHRSGREKHPALRETAADRLRVARWEPPEEGDQWTRPDSAEPTRYDPPTPGKKLTRDEWRAIQYGRAEAPPGFELDPMKRGYLRPIDPARINRNVG